MFKNVYYFLIPIILLGLFFLYCTNQSDLELFPQKQNRFHIFSDSKGGQGNSYIIKKVSKDSVSFETFLKSEYLYPYTGFTFNLPANRTSEKKYKYYYDLSAYDKVEMEISTKNVHKILFSINTFQEGVTDSLRAGSFRHNRKEISLKNGVHKISILTKDLRTPQWWLDSQNVSLDTLNAPRFDLAYNLNFLVYSEIDGISGSVTVKSLKLSKDYLGKWYFLFGICLFYLVVIGLILFFKKKLPKKKEITISYVQRDLNSTISEEDKSETIINFIASNYHKPDLSIKDVADSAQVNQNLVSKILVDYLGKTFKEYLNDLRLKEAKRLLTTTKNSVSEIAYTVGFNSPNSFNRVFKNTEGSSPSEFRNK